MASVSDIIAAGVTRSFLNRADVLATSSTELVKLVDRLQRKAFAVAARLNPAFFGTTAPRSFSGAGYARPVDAENIFSVTQNGADVAVVPVLEQDAEDGLTLYELGGVFIPPTGSAIDTASSVTFWYSRRPGQLTALTDNLDRQWPDSFNDLFIVPVASYLAQKDGRVGEVAALNDEWGQVLALYVAFLEHATSQVRSRAMIPKAVPGQAIQIAKGIMGIT